MSLWARSFPLAAAAALVLGVPLPLARGAGELLTAAPVPSGTVRVARPTLSWFVVPDRETQIVQVNLAVNGTEVRARYSTAEGTVLFTPSRALPPGLYVAKCRVWIRTGQTVGKLDREWSFTVPEDALATLPAPDAKQQDTLKIVNDLRRKLLLPPFQIDPRLCASASAHSSYLRANHANGHEETAGKPGFTGERCGTRMQAFDYALVHGGEDVAHMERKDAAVLTPSEAVHLLLDAPYHRIPFCDPRLEEFGSGHAGGYCTLNFGTARRDSGKPGSVVYPINGQADVPLAFDGHETPDPLRVPRAAAPVGYILSYFAFLPDGVQLHIGEATLTTAEGEAVPFFLNTPANDDKLTNAALIIPKKPLRPRTAYRASLEAKLADGTSLARRWSFTTAAQ